RGLDGGPAGAPAAQPGGAPGFGADDICRPALEARFDAADPSAPLGVPAFAGSGCAAGCCGRRFAAALLVASRTREWAALPPRPTRVPGKPGCARLLRCATALR